MAESFRFELVSPERSLASLEATEVQIPGADGDMTAMANHAPVIATLRPGVVRVKTADGAERDFVVTGGFADLGPGGASVLAERAVAREDCTQELIDELVNKAREDVAKAGPDAADAAAKLLADMVAAGEQIGLATTSRNAAA
jgi:F-type H+-transporting ATPase subunit epsilon